MTKQQIHADNGNKTHSFSWNAYKDHAKFEDWLKPGLPIGEIGVRTAKGGAMVDISIQECFEVATGSNGYKRGGVLYLQATTDEFTFGGQCDKINAGLGFSDAQQKMADANFNVWNMCDLWPRMPLCTDTKKYPLEEALKNLALELTFFEKDELRLIVIDDLTYFMEGDVECATDMVETMNAIRHIAKTFNCACIFLHPGYSNAPKLLNNICYRESIQDLSEREIASAIFKNKNLAKKMTKQKSRPQIIKWRITKQCYGDEVAPIYLERQGNVFNRVEIEFAESTMDSCMDSWRREPLVAGSPTHDIQRAFEIQKKNIMKNI